MQRHKIILNGRPRIFAIELCEKPQRIIPTVDSKWTGDGPSVCPIFGVDLDLVYDDGGMMTGCITSKKLKVSSGTFELWKSPTAEGEDLASLVVDVFKRPIRSEFEGDCEFDPQRLKAFLSHCIDQMGLRLFRVGWSNFMLKPLSGSLGRETAIEVAQFDRDFFAAPSGKRSVKNVAKDFMEVNRVMVGFD